MPIEIRGKYIRERVTPPGKFVKGSLRTLVRGKHRIVVGCPITCPKSGKCSRVLRSGRCPRGMKAQSIMHPLSEKSEFAKRLKK